VRKALSFACKAKSLAHEVPGLARKALSFACEPKSLAREAESLAAGALRLGRGPGEVGRRRLLLGGGGQGLDLDLAGEAGGHVLPERVQARTFAGSS